MPKFLIAVQWRESGQFVVEAESMQAAMDAVMEDTHDKFTTASANGEYIDDTFQIDRGCSMEITDEDHRRFYADETYVSLEYLSTQMTLEETLLAANAGLPLDNPHEVDLRNGGSMEIDPDDGTIRYYDCDGNCENVWAVDDEEYARYKADYFPNVEIKNEDDEAEQQRRDEKHGLYGGLVDDAN
jgi:hypothetical protein